MGKLVAENTYTDRELADLYREAIAYVSVDGKTTTVRGKTYTSHDLDALRELAAYYEARAGGGIQIVIARHARR